MKKIISILLLGAVIFSFGFGSPAFADEASGAKLFKANCYVCHRGGNNTLNPQKTLKKEDLEKYGKYSKEAIVKQITYGKNAMPNFKRLGTEKINDIADYVLSQADKGWK